MEPSIEQSPTPYNRNDANVGYELFDAVKSFSSCASNDTESGRSDRSSLLGLAAQANTEIQFLPSATSEVDQSEQIVESVASGKDTVLGQSVKLGSMNEPEVGTERSDKQAVLAVPANSLQSRDESKEESRVKGAFGKISPSEERKSLDAPSLTSANSFKSQRSGHVSMKSGGSKGPTGSHRSSGSKSSVGTLKSFKSSRNPILELLGDVHKHEGQPTAAPEEDDSNQKNWPALAVIGFLFILTMICAIIDVSCFDICTEFASS